MAPLRYGRMHSPVAFDPVRHAMRLTVLSAAFLLGSVAASLAQTPVYHVTKTVALGAPDRWDYLVYDTPTHRLYVSHGDRLTVLDGRDGKMLGEVVGMPGGTHG